MSAPIAWRRVVENLDSKTRLLLCAFGGCPHAASSAPALLEQLASASYRPAPLATASRSSTRANLSNFWILGLAPNSRRSPPALLICVRQEIKTPITELSA